MVEVAASDVTLVVHRQGGVAYLSKGFGHSIENIGGKTARILIVVDSGHYQTIDVLQWIAGNPTEILATNASQDAAMIERFSSGDVVLTRWANGG